jgi:vacuolar protein sorting-associated protein 8
MASPPSDTIAASHINGHNVDDEQGHSRKPSLGFSDQDGQTNEDDDNTGDYSTRMEELFEKEDDGDTRQDEEDDEEGFVYSGIDADESNGDYGSQLRDVLGLEHEEGYTEDLQVERSLLYKEEDEKIEFDSPVCVAYVSHHTCCEIYRHIIIFCAAW